MSTDPATFYATWPGRMGEVKRRLPEVAKAFPPFFREIMKDGALSAKEKELTAMAIAVAIRCETCIFTHVQKCLKLGATPEQVMEAAGVAVVMGGGPAYAYLAVVAEAVEHLTGAAAAEPGAGG